MRRLIPEPYRILAALLLVLSCIAAGAVAGVTYEANRRDARQMTEDRRQRTETAKEDVRREAVGVAREVQREKIRVVYRTIKEKVNVYIDTHNDVGCGLDADGLRLWNAANSGEAAPLSGEPDYALPGAAAGQIGRVGGLVAEPYRIDGALHAMPGSAREAGGM